MVAGLATGGAARGSATRATGRASTSHGGRAPESSACAISSHGSRGGLSRSRARRTRSRDAFAISSALRPRSEEENGHLEALCATGLSRRRWLLGHVAMTVGGVLAVLAAAGVGLGGSYALVTGDGGGFVRLSTPMLQYAASRTADTCSPTAFSRGPSNSTLKRTPG